MNFWSEDEHEEPLLGKEKKIYGANVLQYMAPIIFASCVKNNETVYFALFTKNRSAFISMFADRN